MVACSDAHVAAECRVDEREVQTVARACVHTRHTRLSATEAPRHDTDLKQIGEHKSNKTNTQDHNFSNQARKSKSIALEQHVYGTWMACPSPSRPTSGPPLSPWHESLPPSGYPAHIMSSMIAPAKYHAELGRALGHGGV
jgi:hypothetical protein